MVTADITLEQELILRDFCRTVDNANLEDSKFLAKSLFHTLLVQKNLYTGLIEHNWFKPKELDDSFKSQLQQIKIVVDHISSSILNGNLPNGWGRNEAQDFLSFSDALDIVLLNLDYLEE